MSSRGAAGARASGAAMVGVVLAGGRSRRMGRDKTRLVVDGEPLVERVVHRLAAVCPRVTIADGGRGLVAGYPSVVDGAGRGPAAGILGAVARHPDRTLLVLACDLPDVPIELLCRLAEDDAGDWLLPRHPGGVEPLCARYRPPALAALAARVAAGDFALHRLLQTPGLDVRFLEGPDLDAFGDPTAMFHNLNVPADLDDRR